MSDFIHVTHVESTSCEEYELVKGVFNQMIKEYKREKEFYLAAMAAVSALTGSHATATAPNPTTTANTNNNNNNNTLTTTSSSSSSSITGVGGSSGGGGGGSVGQQTSPQSTPPSASVLLAKSATRDKEKLQHHYSRGKSPKSNTQVSPLSIEKK